MKNSKQLKEKLQKRFGQWVSLTSNSLEQEEISISGQPRLHDADISFIKKAIKGHFVNYSIHPASGVVYVKIVSDED